MLSLCLERYMTYNVAVTCARQEEAESNMIISEGFIIITKIPFVSPTHVM